MVYPLHSGLCCLALLLTLYAQKLEALTEVENGIRSTTFLSPEFVMRPGSVVDRYYPDIDFPRGHIALKSFNAEVVDEEGVSIPLQETYLHHWVVVRYYQRKGVHEREYDGNLKRSHSDYVLVRNSGICQKNVLGQYFGLGSETRKTATYLPDPYAIEVGDPAQIPPGYEERWLLNVHAIDTRGVADRLACTECRCDLYNITKDEYGIPLKPDYKGGLRCCYDRTQCKVREGFTDVPRKLYLRYTVKWVEWDESIIPVRILIFDVTDNWRKSNNSAGVSERHECQVEYEVEPCGPFSVANDGCIDMKKTSFVIPRGGYVIYGVAHQHSGGVGSVLYGEDGRVICSSVPSYGQGQEAGNEAGYIVGMSTCYPQPGSIKISEGETLTLKSNYNGSHGHTGVMGLFYVLLADQVPKPEDNGKTQTLLAGNEHVAVSVWAIVILGMAVAVAVALGYRVRDEREDGYGPIPM